VNFAPLYSQLSYLITKLKEEWKNLTINAWHTKWSLLLHNVIGDWLIHFAATLQRPVQQRLPMLLNARTTPKNVRFPRIEVRPTALLRYHAHTRWTFPLTLTYDSTSNPMWWAMAITHQDTRTQVQRWVGLKDRVKQTDWQTNGQTDAADCFSFPANAVGYNCMLQCIRKHRYSRHLPLARHPIVNHTLAM